MGFEWISNLFFLRGHASKPGDSAISEKVSVQHIAAMVDRIEKKIDYAISSIDFVRQHMANYLGNGIAVTYLRDETPIYVNSNDFGPSSNYINGGLYESENLDVLLSFVRDDSVFLDIGANVGFFALQVARRVHRHGKVHAFEPHPDLVRLIRGSAFLNGFSTMDGLKGALIAHPYGVGDKAGAVELFYPQDHLGGGGQSGGADPLRARIISEFRTIDECLGQDFVCDLVKIDVEGHELEVLKGMRSTIERSKEIKLIFEKFGHDAGPEAEIEALLRGLGLDLFGIETDAHIRRLAPGELRSFSGYALATRPVEGLDATNRMHFSIFPRQLFVPPSHQSGCDRDALRATGRNAEILFHGPYWFLGRGAYRLSFSGDIAGELEITIAARFGFPVNTFVFDANIKIGAFIAELDLVKFEIIGRTNGAETSIILRELHIERIA